MPPRQLYMFHLSQAVTSFCCNIPPDPSHLFFLAVLKLSIYMLTFPVSRLIVLLEWLSPTITIFILQKIGWWHRNSCWVPNLQIYYSVLDFTSDMVRCLMINASVSVLTLWPDSSYLWSFDNNTHEVQSICIGMSYDSESPPTQHSGCINTFTFAGYSLWQLLSWADSSVNISHNVYLVTEGILELWKFGSSTSTSCKIHEHFVGIYYW